MNILWNERYHKSAYIINICPKTRWKIDGAGYSAFTWLEVKEALLQTWKFQAPLNQLRRSHCRSRFSRANVEIYLLWRTATNATVIPLFKSENTKIIRNWTNVTNIKRRVTGWNSWLESFNGKFHYSVISVKYSRKACKPKVMQFPFYTFQICISFVFEIIFARSVFSRKPCSCITLKPRESRMYIKIKGKITRDAFSTFECLFCREINDRLAAK